LGSNTKENEECSVKTPLKIHWLCEALQAPISNMESKKNLKMSFQILNTSIPPFVIVLKIKISPICFNTFLK
jgi:predicted GTPase